MQSRVGDHLRSTAHARPHAFLSSWIPSSDVRITTGRAEQTHLDPCCAKPHDRKRRWRISGLAIWATGGLWVSNMGFDICIQYPRWGGGEAGVTRRPRHKVTQAWAGNLLRKGLNPAASARATTSVYRFLATLPK